jgi:hypothetical protein
MKHTDTNLDFIARKIETASTALCTLEHPLFFIKTHVVQASKVDENGNIWFSVPQQSTTIAADLHTFSLSMQFYKKQLGYYVTVDALATAANDEGRLMIKAKIIHAEYTELAQEAVTNKVEVFQQLTKKVMHLWQMPNFSSLYRLNSGH